MSAYLKILPVANQILKKYDLCDHCLGRLFSKRLRLSSNRLLGRRLNSGTASNCYVCKNLFENMDHLLKLMTDASLGYSFKTFGVGAVIKPSIVDRDDLLRSKYRLRGTDGIKTDITRELGRRYSKKTRAVIDHLDPEITLTVNLRDESCELRSKSVTLSGRYVKSERDLYQKQKPCDNCLGKGCRMCDFHGIAGFDSVEGAVSECLFKKFGGTTARFTWIGGEDKSSLVLGNGRPFFVKIQNPLKRRARLSDVAMGSVRIFNLKFVAESPKMPLKFHSVIRAKILAESAIDSKRLERLKNLANPIAVYDKSGKRHERRVFDVAYRCDSASSVTLTLRAEGGLPIKRLVAGGDVVPSVSEILGVSCKCQEFDFLGVHVESKVPAASGSAAHDA